MSAVFRVLVYLPGKIARYLSRVDMESGGVACPSAVYFQTHNPEQKIESRFRILPGATLGLGVRGVSTALGCRALC